MTKSQLIEALASVPEDATVYVWDFGAGGPLPVGEVEILPDGGAILNSVLRTEEAPNA